MVGVPVLELLPQRKIVVLARLYYPTKELIILINILHRHNPNTIHEALLRVLLGNSCVLESAVGLRVTKAKVCCG